MRLLEQYEGTLLRILKEDTAQPDKIEALFPVLLKYPYMFIGGVAVSLHTGGKRRVTRHDVDIAVDERSVEDLLVDLKQIGLQELRKNRFAGATWHVMGYKDQSLDVREIDSNDEYFERALSQADTVPYKGERVHVISKPFLICNKMDAGREKDYRDVLYVLKNSTPEEIQMARKLIRSYTPNRSEDFAELMNDMDFSYETIDQMYPLE